MYHTCTIIENAANQKKGELLSIPQYTQLSHHASHMSH